MPQYQVRSRQITFAIVRDEPTAPPSSRRTVLCARDIAEIARSLIADEACEVILAVLLDARHRVMGVVEVARGTANAARCTGRDVFFPAIQTGAIAVAMAHNHPSGEVSPSRSDRQVTQSLRTAADILGIPLIDHVIVAPGSEAVYSFAESDGWSAA